MTYVMSDLHGAYGRYMSMLEKIKFSGADVLYILGDVVDYGPEPMKLLHDMSMRANVIPIMGNHDFVTLDILRQLPAVVSPDSLKRRFGKDLAEFTEYMEEWFRIGGKPTLDSFMRESGGGRKHILQYLSGFYGYKVITVTSKTYVLSHAGIPSQPRNKKLASYRLDNWGKFDWLQAGVDYGRQYFTDAFLVTGHLPTSNISESSRGKIYCSFGHIAIDTGSAFGEAMGCLCLDTGEEFYVS